MCNNDISGHRTRIVTYFSTESVSNQMTSPFIYSQFVYNVTYMSPSFILIFIDSFIYNWHLFYIYLFTRLTQEIFEYHWSTQLISIEISKPWANAGSKTDRDQFF